MFLITSGGERFQNLSDSVSSNIFQINNNSKYESENSWKKEELITLQLQISRVKKNSVYEPSGPLGQCLTPVSIAWSD